MPVLVTANHMVAQILEAEYSRLIYLGQVFVCRQRYHTNFSPIPAARKSSLIQIWIQVDCVGQPHVVGVVAFVGQNTYIWNLMDNCMIKRMKFGI
jgi:hypothetical protein